MDTKVDVKSSIPTKQVVLILLEPGLNESDYESKYIPLIEKYLDFDLFAVHVIGSSVGSRALMRKFNNVHVIPFYPTKSCGLGFYLGYVLYLVYAFLKVFRISSKTNASIIVSLCGHSYSGFVATLVAKVLRRKSLVRISELTRQIVYVRYRMGPLISSLVSIAEHFTFGLCDVVISNRDMFWYSHKIRKKQKVLSQGIDFSLFNPNVIPAFCSKHFPKVVTVARLDKQKNIRSVIRAVNLLNRKYPKIACYIAGSGPDETSLKDEVIMLGLESHVIFCGYVTPSRIPRLIKSCDIFVLPSFSEALPSSVLEAMACGLPVVLGPAFHGLEEWQKVALVTKGDAYSIAEAIESLLSNQNLMSALKLRGLNYVKEKHDSAKSRGHLSELVIHHINNLQR